MLAPYRGEFERLQQIPGVDRVVAATIVAELGVDMTVFASYHHAAAYLRAKYWRLGPRIGKQRAAMAPVTQDPERCVLHAEERRRSWARLPRLGPCNQPRPGQTLLEPMGYKVTLDKVA